MQETVERLTKADANDHLGYEHLIIYAHGGLNPLGAEAQRIATWKRNNIFGRNRLYNFHLMWDSGFIDEVLGSCPGRRPSAASAALCPTGSSRRGSESRPAPMRGGT
jgi:hypothetical protein